MTFGRSAIRLGAGSWSGHRGRHRNISSRIFHHKDTPFRDQPDGTLQDTLHLLAILRLMFPHVLLPATTALGTIHPLGREMGIKAGANVVMPNLSPRGVRKKYLLYDGKICTGDEAAECRACMERRIAAAGYKVVVSRGDYRA